MEGMNCPCLNCICNRAQNSNLPCVKQQFHLVPPTGPPPGVYVPKSPTSAKRGADAAAASSADFYYGSSAGPSTSASKSPTYKPYEYKPGSPGIVGGTYSPTGEGYYYGSSTQPMELSGGESFYGAATGATGSTYSPQVGTSYGAPQTGKGKAKAAPCPPEKVEEQQEEDYEERFRQIAHMNYSALSEIEFNDGEFIDVGYVVAMCLLRKTVWDDRLYATSTMFALPNVSEVCNHAYQVVVVSVLSMDGETVDQLTGVAQQATFYADNLAEYKQAVLDVLTDVVIASPDDGWTGIIQMYVLIKMLGLYLCKYLHNNPMKKNVAICHLKEQILLTLDLCTNTYSSQPECLNWLGMIDQF